MAIPVYPGTLPTLPSTTPSPTTTRFDQQVGGLYADERIDQNAAETNAICATLGVNPQGGSATVAARLAGIDTALGGKANTTHGHTAIQITDSTSVGRALLTAASAADARDAIGAGRTVYQEWTTPGTYTDGMVKPDGALYVDLEIIGGSAGANSGGVSLTGNAAGGASSNCGQIVRIRLPAAAFGDLTTVVVGAPGIGATGGNSVAGTAGGASSVGSIVAAGSAAGTTGSSVTPTPATGSLQGGQLYQPQRGSNGGNTTAAAPTATDRVGPTSGGGGGGKTASVQAVGAPGGAFVANPIGLPATGATGGSAGAGSGADGGTWQGYGLGGAGGGASTSGKGGKGGNGGWPGGGAGGGGAGTTDGGDGGDGAGGVVRARWTCTP